jgi:ATP-dependent helicase HrpB
VDKSGDTDALAQLRSRAAFVHAHRPDFPLIDDARIDEVLAAACVGKRSFADLEQANLLGVLARDARALDRLAPARIELPGGRRLAITYEPGHAPWVGSRLQDFFGMTSTPRVLDGAVAIVVHLRAPNRHDVAVTSDLAAFWREHYPQLRTRLSRRYPKHDWPDDPARATPPSASQRRR